ncbi:acyltransferase 3 [Thermothelomyces heterothallicus CBS 202.75]|uniref:acyltransferase 3 n=1 Tax=Thermothelomyces heterothallicus CBS 202.75 TaxID=1149848 RepID=UPI00374279FF
MITTTSPSHRRGTPSTSSIQSLLTHGPIQSWIRFLRPLLPSFVADDLFPEHRPTWRLHPTSYLDGLRGIAAIIVFICHYTENNFRPLTRPYAPIPPAPGPDPPLDEPPMYGSKDLPDSLIQLPFVRSIFSGRPMVHIFFVISGFALSYKPVQALHARDTAKCYAALASSAFRRPFRLFGPCIVSTFLIMCLRQLGCLPGGKETLAEELWRWRGAVFHQVTWPWAWDHDLRPAYDVHLWTIPIEFAHSMLLFMVVLMLSRVRLPVRLAAELGLIGYCLVCGKWAGFEFLAGLFLAEMHVLRAARAKEWEGHEEMRRSRGSTNWALKAFQVFLIVLGLFIGGWPNRFADRTPGIRYFLVLTPSPFATMDALAPQKFWFGLSAVATVWAVGDLAPLRRFFEGPLAQYCGRISYAVYICHGPVEELFKDWFLGHPPIPEYGEPGAPDYKPPLPATGVKGLVGYETITQITVGWILGLWLLAPVVIWAADLFWRSVDSPLVSLARKLEMMCLDETEPSPRSQGYSAAA